ncbi:mucin-5B-like [Homarus americanus]|uniref:mucin-5B-like n=1 Tax=Homarus americanus TaxID=6706 RepID=UPI001C47A3BB|nr:mucin-5B-like [Homarus americanus]XP_042204363.1 mucin-5B-like [Homarus americanus]
MTGLGCKSLSLLFLPMFGILASTSNYTAVTPKPEPCCYGKRKVPHGEVFVSLPEICVNLVCQYGEIVRVYLEGDTKSCCEFDGILYPNGAELELMCFKMICKKGRWSHPGTIDRCCKHCTLYNDPHIRTFDGYQYDWHGRCNYSIAQSDTTLDPYIGIFSDFVPCVGEASCLAHTTYRVNPHTIITLKNSAEFDLEVNGQPFHVPLLGVRHLITADGTQHPVLVFRSTGCIVLISSSGIVVMHCRYRLDVWAHPNHTNHLDGLCGHFNFYQRDDFTNRDGEIHALHYWPLAFPLSWLTSEQLDRKCLYRCPEPHLTCSGETTTSPCYASASSMVPYTTNCTAELQPIIGKAEDLQSYIDTCAFDLCLELQNGGNPDSIYKLLTKIKWVLKVEKAIYLRTFGSSAYTP